MKNSVNNDARVVSRRMHQELRKLRIHIEALQREESRLRWERNGEIRRLACTHVPDLEPSTRIKLAKIMPPLVNLLEQAVGDIPARTPFWVRLIGGGVEYRRKQQWRAIEQIRAQFAHRLNTASVLPRSCATLCTLNRRIEEVSLELKSCVADEVHKSALVTSLLEIAQRGTANPGVQEAISRSAKRLRDAGSTSGNQLVEKETDDGSDIVTQWLWRELLEAASHQQSASASPVAAEPAFVGGGGDGGGGGASASFMEVSAGSQGGAHPHDAAHYDQLGAQNFS